MTNFAAEVARKVSGQCDDAPLVMGGEDFAFMLEHCPGSYFMIGNGAGQATGHSAVAHACMVHNPGYDFNDDILSVGAEFWTTLALAFFSTTPKRETS